MALPKLPKKEPRPKAVTIRLSNKAAENLKMLAEENNLSQADVIEHLVNGEAEMTVITTKKSKKRD